LKVRLWLLAALFLVLGLLLIFEVEAGDFPWKDDFNYASVADMQEAGWTLVNPDGVSLQPDGVVIDGTEADTVIRFYNFPGGIYEWSIETRSMWLGVGASGPGINVVTTGHSYGIAADGWYGHFIFDRDGEAETFGSYSEQANVWVTMSMTKKGGTVCAYFNGELIKTYTEQDSASYGLTGVARIAPWKGVMLYDYFRADAVDSGFPLFYVAVGGGIAAIVVVGAAAYFFFFAGGSVTAATAAAAAASGATTGALSGAVAASLAGKEADALCSFASNLVSDTVTDTLNSIGYSTPGSSEPGAELALRSDSDSVAEAVTDMVSNTVVDAIEGSGCFVAKPEVGAYPGLGGQTQTDVDVQVGGKTGPGTQGSKPPDFLGF